MTGTDDWFPVRVTAKVRDGGDVFLFDLADPMGVPLPAFQPGAHIDVAVGGAGDGTGLTRQYSLYSAPADNRRYGIAVQREAEGRGGSRTLCDTVAAGDTVRIRRPRALFTLAAGATSHVMIAGGIGITPLLSMASHLAGEGGVTLHYLVRRRERAALLDTARQAVGPENLHLHVTAETGRPDLAVLIGPPAPGRHFYLCGPAALLDAAIATAEGLGWPADHIHLERFAAEPGTDASANRPFLLRLRSTGAVIPVMADQTAAEALAGANVELPISCAEGVCGACITGVLDGTPEHRDCVLTEAEHKANRLFTPCCSRAVSEMLVVDL
ncbi:MULTISPECIES: PDR/VanB family oxidoreductase [Nitrospirillum]|uniref:Vanillate O-demethylase ferredoxin subunit n=1 Tax=Nitrospirillum amazonense TaxID=28077 RepID=A0A560G3E6_9PROT|nr:PDR/VanB family oxidoreductase [Nitrospirillum amazonense]MEC4591971.1 PDR/VanB family oxidoreductase [Nitrospirillum amazonense]TWB28364.1 vanillate O-demethylase ferredoxin subunit [Nitrospirillum amazonense]